MKVLIQRVLEAHVNVEERTVGQIGPGLLVFLGVEKNDTSDVLEKLADKVLKFRIFSDEAGRMNRSVQDENADIMVVSQFTLAGDTRKGNRPGFDNAMAPDKAERFYEKFVQLLKEKSILKVETGKFGASMQVSLINDGPVTFLIEL